MRVFAEFRGLTPAQRNTFAASFLGWTLDAFDFFILPFTAAAASAEFHVSLGEFARTITLTLAMRPLGALLFGVLADRFGRRGPLMVDIILFSILELASGFAPTFTVFLILRALFGIAMGGEWGLGAALALESLPAESRGFFSGLLQQGYAFGYLLAALAYGLLFEHIGWRGMFIVGSLPALLVVFIRARVPESPAFLARAELEKREPRSFTKAAAALVPHWRIFLFAIVMMTAFNSLSHGTQDNFPRLLEQHGLVPSQVSFVAIIASCGAIVGGTLFGGFSQRIGRRRAIVTAVAIGLIVLPFWAQSSGLVALAIGGFCMQFAVQGAWGVVPAHLTELSPGMVRGMFPGVVYQLGNLIASGVAELETRLATGPLALPDGKGDYAHAMLQFVCVALLCVGLITALGPERRSIAFTEEI